MITSVAVSGIEPDQGHDAHDPTGYYRRGETPGTMPNLYQTGQSRETQLWSWKESWNLEATRPVCRGPSLYFLDT